MKENSKEKDQDPQNILDKLGSPPVDANVINVISGGSDICRTSYFVAKKHVSVSKTEKEEKSRKNTSVTNE